ncbi:MAG: M48 family metalloprotease [Anaerohalosphaera sp.]|nr:M48 family metalloprotease [Anaerohalosphaera sp.]
MPEYVWYIGFAVSLILTSSICILIARRVFRSGVEHFSSKILVLSGIINTILCGLLFLTQGIYEVIRISASDPIHLSQFVIPLVFMAVPVRILWNYFSIQRKPVVQHNLQPCTNKEVNTEIAAICKTMGINPPTVLSSDIVKSPFVFGRRSSKAILAIPDQWLNSKSRHQHIQLLHELSHIRNHDVGFLAWSNASLRDLRFLLIFLPALTVYCFALGYNHIVPSILLYLACSLILFVMLRYVIRKRESLADLTAAMMVESGQVKEVITSQETYTISTDISSRQQARPRYTDKIQRWLSDKAMFSKRQKLWKALLEVFNFLNLLHPKTSSRVNTINSQNTVAQQLSTLGESFWAGIAIGLLSVIIGLGSYWFAVFIQKPTEDIGVIRLPFDVYGMLSMIPPGFLAVFLALPVWSSLKRPTLDGQYFLSLLARYAMALLGACLACPLILIAGAVNQDVLLLLVICVLWNIFITVFSFGISAIIIPLWVTIRYYQFSDIAELRNSIWALGLFIIAIFSSISVGIILICNDMFFYGSNVIFSTIAGGAFVSLTYRGTRFYKAEQFIILCAPFLIFRIEGRWFKILVFIIHSFYSTVLLLIFTPLIYLAIDLALGNLFQNIDSTLGIIIAIAASCTVMVLLERNGLKRISERKRSKINILYHCLKHMSTPINTNNRKRINEVINSYDLKMKSSRTRKSNLTMHDTYEIITMTQDDASQRKILDHVSAWVLRCQSQGGFGIWPKSSPRLYSTYQAISILRDVDLLDKCNADLHISWIKTLQQPDGSFKGPWSKRDLWQETFFAVKSLSILEASLDPDKAGLCRNWCNNILANEGLKSDRPDINYYCFAALTALGNVDEDISKLVSDWLSSKIEELLLTNVSLDYENIHFAVMVYSLFDRSINIPEESINLLSERIQTALKAELADIRI